MSADRLSSTRGLEMLLSVACGVCVASLYYIQPLEAVVAAEFGIPAVAAGIAVTCVQLGYAAGLLLGRYNNELPIDKIKQLYEVPQTWAQNHLASLGIVELVDAA